MPYHIFICDDEPQMLQCPSASVKAWLSDSEISVFSDGGRLQAALEDAGGGSLRNDFRADPCGILLQNGSCAAPCDILLLDIDMPGLLHDAHK